MALKKGMCHLPETRNEGRCVGGNCETSFGKDKPLRGRKQKKIGSDSSLEMFIDKIMQVCARCKGKFPGPGIEKEGKTLLR
jgi:hypothetical protein